jgi:hypothetical protein
VPRVHEAYTILAKSTFPCRLGWLFLLNTASYGLLQQSEIIRAWVMVDITLQSHV